MTNFSFYFLTFVFFIGTVRKVLKNIGNTEINTSKAAYEIVIRHLHMKTLKQIVFNLKLEKIFYWNTLYSIRKFEF